MKRINLQFHAMPEEVAEMVDSVICEKGLFVTCLGVLEHFRIQPFEKRTFCSLAYQGMVFLAIQETSPVLMGNNRREYESVNVGALYLQQGRQRDNSLGESALSGNIDRRSKNLIALPTFFKRRLHKGGRAINPVSGISAEIPTHYFSDGAASWERANGRLLAFAGGNVYSVL